MTDDPEVYPMPLFPQFAVSDVERSREWYEALGFDVVYSMGVMVHLRYRTYADVMLVTDRAGPGDDAPTDGTESGAGVTIYLTLEDESVDDVVDRASQHGIAPTRDPHRTAWNTREVVFEDPDGYAFAFSEPVDTERSFEDVVGEGASGP